MALRHSKLFDHKLSCFVGHPVVELKVQYFRENFKIHLILIKHVYGVQVLNKNLKSFVIFHQLFKSAEETFLQLFNNQDKICKVKKYI